MLVIICMYICGYTGPNKYYGNEKGKMKEYMSASNWTAMILSLK